MRFHHSVLLAALAIAPVCAERIKVSNEQGIVNSTLSAVGGVDCGGGGLRSSGGGGGGGGLGCDQIISRRMVGGVTTAAGGRAEKKDAVVVGGRGATVDDELRCNDVQRVLSRGISGSRRGKQNVSSPTANPRTTIPGGGDRRAMGAVYALDCGEGGGIAGTTRTMMTMTRKRTSVSSLTAAAAAAATTAIAHCSTAGGARRRRR